MYKKQKSLRDAEYGKEDVRSQICLGEGRAGRRWTRGLGERRQSYGSAAGAHCFTGPERRAVLTQSAPACAVPHRRERGWRRGDSDAWPRAVWL